MVITKDSLERFEVSSRKEWLISNGIGGFSSSTVIGLNTRKYHALLVAALGESGDRYVILPKLNEILMIEGVSYSISTNQCNNFIEKGYKYQSSFKLNLLPEFVYEVKDLVIRKTVGMKYGENKIAVVYKVTTGKKDATLKVQPLVNYRSFHTTRNCYNLDTFVRDEAVNIKLTSKGLFLHMNASTGIFNRFERTYYRNMFYNVEDERGLDAYEDHYMPGEYVIDVPKNSEVTFEFVASVDDNNDYLTNANASEIIRRETTRLEKICKIASAKSDVEKHLAISADSFIVQRGNRKTIIAGYPWFGDWGRDTFIAFEGLLLRTNRYKDAKEILKSFAPFVKNGLIPNLIDEEGGSAYNTVDASLWYIDAVYKYYKYTHDLYLVSELYDTLKSIVDAYRFGTDYEIKMDENDCLISAGSPKTQLTWMDAKVGDLIPTPRNGKAVEINALWYNALKIMERFSMELDKDFDNSLGEKVRVSFKKFYADKGLLDTIDPISDKIRPNQIIAIGLDYSPVDAEKSKEILELAEERLYTKQGLKTLSSEYEEYRGRYEGGVYSRDTSYHQGTVWPWLLQPYFEASRKFKGKYRCLEDAQSLMNDDCIGSIAEIYDADEPRLPKGAFSQAWSVAMAILNT